jgi:tetratricopeptide (TPR) repeat protein
MRIFENNKNGRILFFTLALCMMTLLLPSQNSLAENSGNRDLFALGNEAYANKDYNQAIVHYQAALESEGYSPSLLYNLGNAYYMKKEIGQAILNYERALYLDPDNTDIKANLALARKNFGLTTSDEAAWKTFFNRLNLNGWTWIAVMALCIFSLMVLINGVRPGLFERPAPKLLVCLCLLAFMAAGGGMAAQYENLSRGVITADNARLRVSPFDSAADSGVVKNGKMVNLTDNYKGYVFAKTQNGKSGWLPKKAVSEILPTNENHPL